MPDYDIPCKRKEIHCNAALPARHQHVPLLDENQPEEVAWRFAECHVGDVVMSAITYAELQYGASAAADPERERSIWRF
jgi:hypothetical protein